MKTKISILTVVIMILSLLPVYAQDDNLHEIDDPLYFTTLYTMWDASSFYIGDKAITTVFKSYFDQIENMGYGRLRAQDIDFINNNSYQHVLIVERPNLEYDSNLQTYVKRKDNNTDILIFTSDYPFNVRLDALMQNGTGEDWHALRIKGTSANQNITAHHLFYEDGSNIKYVRTSDALFVPLNEYRFVAKWSGTGVLFYFLRGRGINHWAGYVEKDSVINDPDQQDDDRYIYVSSSSGYYIDPRIFHDYDHAQTILDQLVWHSKGYSRVAAYVKTRAGPMLLVARNYDDLDTEQTFSLILPIAVNKQHFNQHSFFDLDIYVWTPEAVDNDDPLTAHPEGYTDKLETIRVFFTAPPKTCPDGYNCDDPDPNKWYPVDPDRSTGSGLPRPKIPQKPDNNWDIIGWIMYIIDWIIYIVESIIYVLARIGELIVQFFSGATGFINILSTYFNFLPKEIVSVIVLGILTSLLAALLRR